MRFLALYLLSGLAGSAMVLWFTGEPGADRRCLRRDLRPDGRAAGDGRQGRRQRLRRSRGWLLINVVITFTFPNISWQGHLGGFLGGVLIAAVIAYAPRAAARHLAAGRARHHRPARRRLIAARIVTFAASDP